MPPTYPDIPKAFELTGEPLFTLGTTGEPGDVAGIGIVWDWSYTNAHFTMLLVILLLSGVAILVTRRLTDRPGGLQNFVELLVQGLADFVESIGGPSVLKYLPLFGTLLLFLVTSNWLSVVPFVGQVSWLHAPTADYHINAGLAILAFGLYQAEGLRQNGPSYLKRWVNLSGFMEKGGLKFMLGPIFLLVGLIEFASELFRMLTLTLRLWGNVLGGEIMLVVMSALLFVPGVALPFVGLEVFIGLVQGLIFSLLVLIYFILATESHEEHGETEHALEPHPDDVQLAHATPRAA
ncbi:MAG TPA: FoF1 ATP synthase subunit a [Candidatus Limnocylindria bacterium]|nr:FoF1 ATP synthase subunit a [Candidatus Limnocylindria bacterium]